MYARVTEEKPNLVEIPKSEPESAAGLRKRKVKKRVLPEFYQSVQVTPTRKPVGTPLTVAMIDGGAVICCSPPQGPSCASQFGKVSTQVHSLSAECKPRF